jgi:hypothetical protein
MLKGFKARERGFSHIQNGKPCQDAAEFFIGSKKHTGLAIAAVADGHGGDKYFRSEIGSNLAVKIATQELKDFYHCFLSEPGQSALLDVSQMDDKRLKTNIERIEDGIVRLWRKVVAEHARQFPWTEDETAFCASHKIALPDPDTEDLFSAYGTTLIAALMAPGFWFATQIGDGLCVVLDPDGKPRLAIPEDDEQGFGYTHSICASNAAEKFQRAYGLYADAAPIAGITVATDGVADSFTSAGYLTFTADLRENFVKTPEDTAKELQAYLPKLSEQGSRDDCAIAGIFSVGNPEE